MEKSKDSFQFSRRDLKRDAKTNLKHHYLMYVVACLFSLIIQAEFLTSDNLISVRRQVVTDAIDAAYELTGADDVKKIERAYKDLDQDADSLYTGVREFLYSKTLDNDEANKVLGRTRGTLNQIINYVTEDTIVSNIYSIIIQFLAFGNIGKLLIIILLAIIAAFAWLFVRNVYIAVNRRIFLEGRIYKRIPFSRYLFFIRMKRWIRASFTMAVRTVIELLGMSTIVGFPIVHFGFFLMPYIIAENPDIKPFEAAKLSWLMMRGNKWNLFKMSLSFMGWYILGSFTFGLSNILFSNPYMICCYSEYYAKIRQHAKEKGIPGAEKLNDEYLFLRADSNKLADTYADVLDELAKPENSLETLEGRREKFFAKNFGVILWNSKEEIEYENREAFRMKMHAYEKEAKGLVYPSRLSPIPEQRKIKALDNIHYMRHYSLSSIAMLFFIFSNFGWTWELFYYFLMKGQLINRGFNHGPWLPIYGFGGLIVLMGLNRVRNRPVIFFFSTIISCGAVEYFTSWILEVCFDKKWWDYSGYFLNLNSRICAEGLFVFGICGLAFIYVLAPLLDNLIRKINRRVLLPLAVTLVLVMAADFVYSNFVPNTGYGITGNFDKEDKVAVETVTDN
ncbi:MAG: DUF975 family protein [Lachnospiraceae bacterium]|nr:DUF975 family protein [Lachnospiraceae bacterium]